MLSRGRSMSDTFAAPLDDLVRRARTLARTGRYLDAQSLLPALESAATVPALVVAARIVGHLGAQREAETRFLRLWRRHRRDAQALVEMVRTATYRRGPYRGWRLLRERALPADAPASVVADWHSLRAFVHGSLRDFEHAEQAYASACAAGADEPWIHVEWSHVCEMRDRYDEAIEHAQRALQLQPGMRSAVQTLARLFTLTGRTPDALALLQQALQGGQSASIAISLFELQHERREYAAAAATLDEVERLSPRAEKPLRLWLAARRADVELACGRFAQAGEHAAAAGGPFYTRLAERLQSGEAKPRRVELPVGFVRQHHRTCAPATLAALSRFWGRDADHLEIAEQICYDGTANHSERNWAEQQGLVTREFTVDWNSTTALLDAGVPFTLTTVGTASAHLQAVIGYDALRGTLLIRDPFKPTFAEFEAQALFESHRCSGPRGMLLLPPDQAHRLAGIELPDASAWDAMHAVMHALSAHRRDDAQRAAEAAQAAAPEHRMTLQALRALASYDGDREGELAIVERLLHQDPDEINLQLAKASLLSMVGSRTQQHDWWRQCVALPAPEPVALTRYADFLSDDGREHRVVCALYRRALTAYPTYAPAWRGLAAEVWQSGARELARDLSGVASRLDDMHEGLAETHFRTRRFMGETEEGLGFLRERVRTLGAKSSAPVVTLFSQLEELERSTEAFALLDQALALRPHDGELLLFGARAMLRYARLDDAKALLERAEPHANRVAWLREKARMLREGGDPAAALALARRASELDPLDIALHRLIAELLAQCEGRKAALGSLRDAARAQPHHVELQQTLVGWLGSEERAEAIEVLRRLLRVNPAHSWAMRELASELALAGQIDEAQRWAQAALDVAPHQTSTHSTLAFVAQRQGRLDDARRHLRDAIGASVDNNYAIDTLVEIEPTREERRTALAFVEAELQRQVTLGDGLLTFQEVAQHVLEAGELRKTLDDLLAVREDLWQAWAAAAIQRVRDGDCAGAVALLDRAIERFPLLSRLHVEKARTLMLLNEREAARACLRQALQIHPAWLRAVRLFVETVTDEGSGFERALAVLDSALHRVPEDAELKALRARILRRMGRHEAALDELRAAAVQDPSLRWAWDAFAQDSREAKQPLAARELAEQVTQRHPGNVSAWLRLAEHVDFDRALAATERALALEPRNEAAFVARLDVLYRAGRDDELEAALRSAPWGEPLPPAVAVFRARLARKKGDLREATELMHALLERDPNDYTRWNELADWYDERNLHADYVQAAQHMVRLAPHHSTAHGFLGHACQKAERFDDARRHFGRALELDPGYLFAGLRLADLQLDAGLLDDAAATLQTLRPHHTGAQRGARAVRLAVLRRDEAAAAAALAELIGNRDAPAPLCHEALQRLCEAGWEGTALRVVADVFARGACARSACLFWVDRQGRGWRLPFAWWRDVRRGLAADPAHSLKIALADRAGDASDAHLLNKLLKLHRASLHGDDEGWGVVSYAYLEQNRPAETVRWMADWETRAHAPPWALDNLALALRRLGRHRQARAVTERSLHIEPRNLDGRSWLTVDAAMAGRLDELRLLLASIDKSALRPFYRNLLTAAASYYDAASAGDSGKSLSCFSGLWTLARRDPVLRRLLLTLTRRLLAEHTPRWLRPWRWLQFTLRVG